MRANVYGRYDRELMVSTYSEKLARLYKAQLDLYKLIIEDAETSEIEAVVSRLAALSFELTQMPDIPETVKEWRERIMEKAFPRNAISGSPNCAVCGAAPPAAGSGVPGQMVTPRDAAGGLTAGTALGRGPGAGVINWRATPGTDSPPRWKQWLVSLVAAYPLVLLFQAFIAPQIKDWPLEARSAVLPLCVLTLLTYVVMPPVSRLLRGWLHPFSQARWRGRSRQHSSGTIAARVRSSRDGRGRTAARCWLGREARRPGVRGVTVAHPYPKGI